MKTLLFLKCFFIFSVVILAFSSLVSCEGCNVEVSANVGHDCTNNPDEGSFFLDVNIIEVGGACPVSELPSDFDWEDFSTWTSEIDNPLKYYVQVRVTGFCDGLNMQVPFTSLYKGVDANDLIPVIINGRKGFRINNIPIDRALNVYVDIREPCHTDDDCFWCDEDENEFRNKLRGANIFSTNVNNNDVIPILLPPDPEPKCC